MDLVWELQWFSKTTERLEGEVLLDFARVDSKRLQAVCGRDSTVELNGGLDIKTPEAIAYIENVSGLELDRAVFNYQIEAVRR